MSGLTPPPRNLLDDDLLDDLLAEILLRLPPKPASLPRASAVCKRWLRVVSDPGFSRRFRHHHRAKVPLLGCFLADSRDFYFEPTMDPPDRVPRGRFPSMLPRNSNFRLCGCRHGLALLLLHGYDDFQVKVWDPVGGAEQCIDPPREFVNLLNLDGAVLRTFNSTATAAEQQQQQHFQVGLVGVDDDYKLQLPVLTVCLYSSKTNSWGNLMSTTLPAAPRGLVISKGNLLVGDSVYWLIEAECVLIIEFDLKKMSIAVIEPPVKIVRQSPQYSLMRADDGGLGCITLSNFTAQLWRRNKDHDGANSWVLDRIVQFDRILPPHLQTQMPRPMIAGLAEENNIIFICMALCVFKVDLQSLQCNQVSEGISFGFHHAFESVYTTDCKKFKDLVYEIAESLAKDEGESEEGSSAAGLLEKRSVSESKPEETAAKEESTDASKEIETKTDATSSSV